MKRVHYFLMVSIILLSAVAAAEYQSVTQMVSHPLSVGLAADEAAPPAGNEADALPGGHDLETIGKKANNPVGSLWMLWFQNDYTRISGDAVDGRERWNTTEFQPVMSFPFEMDGDPWNFIIRPVVQYQSFSFSGDRSTGFGDTALAMAIGPDRDDGTIWGVGVTQIFPTAEHDTIGQEKWQAGPMFLLAHLAPDVGGFNVGVFGQHWWSYAGEDDREETSLTDIQYFIQYRVTKTGLIGMAPNIQYDWRKDSDDALTLPIGLGYQNVFTIGKMPVKWGIEYQYMLVKPDDMGSDWNIRFIFVPIIPSPL